MGFNAIVRVDDRLQPHCCDPGDIQDKLATFSTLYSEIEHEWQVEKEFDQSWISSFVDLPWMQQRVRQMKEGGRSSDVIVETYFAKAHVDRTCAAVIILAPAKVCSTLLSSWPNDNGKKLQVNKGDIFELQYERQDHEPPWVSSFFSTID